MSAFIHTRSVRIHQIRPDAPLRLADRGFRFFGRGIVVAGAVGKRQSQPDFQGAVRTVENRFWVFHLLHGPVFSTALGFLDSVIAEKGLFCSLYSDRASLLWFNAPAAAGEVLKAALAHLCL